MIEVVFWDFGGVFTPSPFAALDRHAASVGVDTQALMEAMFGPAHDTTDHPWHRVERGELALVDAMEQTKASFAELGIEFDIATLFRAMADAPDGDRTLVQERAAELRVAGMRQAIITNNLREFSDGWRSLMPIDDLFDDVIDSSEVGLRKPNPAIYELAMERLQVSPEHSVFLDDLEANVVAARDLGMHGIIVGTDPGNALDELARLTTSP